MVGRVFFIWRLRVDSEGLRRGRDQRPPTNERAVTRVWLLSRGCNLCPSKSPPPLLFSLVAFPLAQNTTRVGPIPPFPHSSPQDMGPSWSYWANSPPKKERHPNCQKPSTFIKIQTTHSLRRFFPPFPPSPFYPSTFTSR